MNVEFWLLIGICALCLALGVVAHKIFDFLMYRPLEAASLPSTENIEKALNPGTGARITHATFQEKLLGEYTKENLPPSLKHPQPPIIGPNDVFCPMCGVLAKKLPVTGDLVRDMNFQYHCRQCQQEVFGGR